MADPQGNPQGGQQQNPNPNGNPIQQMGGGHYSIEQSLNIIAHTMESNPNSFRDILRAPTESQSKVADNSKWKFQRRDLRSNRSRASGNLLQDFESGIKDQLLNSLAGGNFQRGMQGALDTFAKEFGVQLKDLPNEMGRNLTKKALGALKNIQIGDKGKLGDVAKDAISKYGTKALDSIFKNQGENGQAAKDAILKVGQSFLQNGGGGSESILSGLFSQGGAGAAGAAQAAGGAAAEGGILSGAGAAAGAGAGAGAGAAGATAAAGAGAGAAAGGGAALSGVMGAAASLGPWGLLIIGIVYTIVKILGPALKGLAEVVKSTAKSFNRDEELRKKRVENARKRLEADMEWIAKRPFDILQEAAEKWADTWDQNLRKIGQTQGYDKEAVYALYEGYAERLKEENLSSVIPATDILDKLSSVLDSGLSGFAAEEFAYLATKLNAAIPTQDFFGYVDTYASIAANAIAQGKSQSEAIAEANQQLEDFASNLLYSSRELAGGFSVGLKNGSDLFKDAVQIAQTAKKYNAADEISGTLTSVSAIIGSVAPDLASSLVSNVVQAAIGGNNNTQLVALRSLAGINAGNTEFLQALANNPQEVFATLFSSLAELQNMSPDNYMEVAEGLADVFGIDKAALARVDFNYLADAISAMNTNNRSLEENMDLLVSGQTTTSAEQLKAQEIANIITEEGLQYVIDSEAGRMIQEHMWDEQRDNALMNNRYAVDLQGSSLELLEGIRKTITTLLNFLNPAGFIAKGISNMVQTVTEAIGNEQDLKEILELGKVGDNKAELQRLTTRGKDLELVDSYVEMLGGSKGVWFLNAYSNAWKTFANIGPSSGRFNTYNDKAGGTPGWSYTRTLFTTGLGDSLYEAASNIGESIGNSVAKSLGLGPKANSRYTWGAVGKSFAQAVQSSSTNPITIASSMLDTSTTATQKALEAANARMQEFLDSAETALTNNKNLSFDEWVKSAVNFGISNFEDALYDYGSTIEEVKSYFEAHEARQGAIIEEGRKQDEELFRTETRNFWDFSSGTNGIFQTAMWLPFFGDGRKYDTRMDAVDQSLTTIQNQIGSYEKHTVISGIEEVSRKLGDDSEFTVISVLESINSNLIETFVQDNSNFQRCLADWIRYIAESKDYTENVSKSSAWSDYKSAEHDQQTEATLALAQALQVFSAEELQKMDPQLQTNALLGEIVIILQAIMQQTNTPGGLNLIDTISALGLGMTSSSSSGT